MFLEEDKENDIDDTQSNSFTSTITSKDTTHILRLAALLHILQHNLSCALENQYVPTPTEIQNDQLKQAMVLYNVVSQQKSLFVQVKKIVKHTLIIEHNSIHTCK